MMYPMDRPDQIVYVIFQLDTEDFITPETDDVIIDLVRVFNKYGIKGSFAIVGEKARALERRGRDDVINALRTQDIAYQSNYHSVHPTISEYLKDLGWKDGVEEVMRRESEGINDLRRIFGQNPSAFIQPGGSWAPQVVYAMRLLGIKVFADGIFFSQPVWFCGALAVRYSLSFRESESGTPEHLERLKHEFDKLYNSLKDRGGVIIVVLHPCMLLTKEFWDAINFARGRMPKKLKPAPLVPRELYKRRIKEFDEFVRYIINHPNVKVITYRELPSLYEEHLELNKDELFSLAEKVLENPSYHVINNKSFSLADAFYALCLALKEYKEKGSLPQKIVIRPILGPIERPPEINEEMTVKVHDVLMTIDKVYKAILEEGIIPSRIQVCNEVVGPLLFLYMMARSFLSLTGKAPSRFTIQGVSEMSILEDLDIIRRVINQWHWIIFPENFSSEKILELTILQLWTLKPAIMKTEYKK